MQKASDQESKCFYHRGTRKDDRVHGEGIDALRATADGPARSAESLAFSVNSVVLPCSSVLKTLTFLIACRMADVSNWPRRRDRVASRPPGRHFHGPIQRV